MRIARIAAAAAAMAALLLLPTPARAEGLTWKWKDGRCMLLGSGGSGGTFIPCRMLWTTDSAGKKVAYTAANGRFWVCEETNLSDHWQCKEAGILDDPWRPGVIQSHTGYEAPTFSGNDLIVEWKPAECLPICAPLLTGYRVYARDDSGNYSQRDDLTGPAQTDAPPTARRVALDVEWGRNHQGHVYPLFRDLPDPGEWPNAWAPGQWAGIRTSCSGVTTLVY